VPDEGPEDNLGTVHASTTPELPMSKHLRHFRCPCCRERLEFDVRTNQVRRPENARAEGLDELIDSQKSETQRLEAMFDGATSSQGRERDRLDKLFREAQEDAKDDDSKPSTPFDLE
jgi:hypothetical protein